MFVGAVCWGKVMRLRRQAAPGGTAMLPCGAGSVGIARWALSPPCFVCPNEMGLLLNGEVAAGGREGMYSCHAWQYTVGGGWGSKVAAWMDG